MKKEKRLVEDVVESFAPWRWLHTFFKIATIAFLMATVAAIFLIVVMRYVFKTNLYGMDEILTIVTMWLYFMGGIYGTYEESHIQGDLLNLAWTKRWQYKAHKIYIYTVCVFLMALWSFWGVKYFANSIGSTRRNTATKLPFWINQIPIPIGMWGMLFYSVYHLIRNIINPVSSHMTRQEKEALEKKQLGIDGLNSMEEEGNEA